MTTITMYISNQVYADRGDHFSGHNGKGIHCDHFSGHNGKGIHCDHFSGHNGSGLSSSKGSSTSDGMGSGMGSGMGIWTMSRLCHM